jgi:hypothetical protein
MTDKEMALKIATALLRSQERVTALELYITRTRQNDQAISWMAELDLETAQLHRNADVYGQRLSSIASDIDKSDRDSLLGTLHMDLFEPQFPLH